MPAVRTDAAHHTAAARDQVRRGCRLRENTVHHSANGYRDAEGTFTETVTQQIQSSLLSDCANPALRLIR